MTKEKPNAEGKAGVPASVEVRGGSGGAATRVVATTTPNGEEGGQESAAPQSESNSVSTDKPNADLTAETASQNNDAPSKPILIPHGVANEEGTAGEDHTRKQPAKDWERKHSYIGLWVNGIIGVFAVAGFFVLIDQAREAKKNADASDKATATALQLAARSTSAAEEAAKAAAKNAQVGRDSFQATIEAQRLEHRARLAVSQIRFVSGAPQVGQPLTVQVVLKNSGKTPARRIETRTVIDPILGGVDPVFAYGNDRTVSIPMLPPGEYTLSLTATKSRSTGRPAPITKELLDEVMEGRIRIFVHGRVS